MFVFSCTSRTCMQPANIGCGCSFYPLKGFSVVTGCLPYDILMYLRYSAYTPWELFLEYISSLHFLYPRLFWHWVVLRSLLLSLIIGIHLFLFFRVVVAVVVCMIIAIVICNCYLSLKINKNYYYMAVSQGLGTTKFTNLIGWNGYWPRSRISHLHRHLNR